MHQSCEIMMSLMSSQIASCFYSNFLIPTSVFNLQSLLLALESRVQSSWRFFAENTCRGTGTASSKHGDNDNKFFVSSIMKVLVQNLQKRNGLASSLDVTYTPDILLVQEIYLQGESLPFKANNVSRMGYGTAIGVGSGCELSPPLKLTHVQRVDSPYAEFGGLIHKKTTLARVELPSKQSTGLVTVQLVSFHGYNGQPFQNIEKLIAHIDAVLKKIQESNSNNMPALFAGDFNSWSKEHIDAVTKRMESDGFQLVYSWPYPNRELPLDHAFVRGLALRNSQNYECSSDHRGALLEFDVL